ncbi:replication initiation protein [Piscirickettsia salmonis]|uniref:replication initiation protein n=1 Tax=Piscirickettsia salmonis TaxID=1238 RepID=UPI0012BA6226|nr:replication initiation protein [Piscirickettsia salmonis]QGP62167.1 Replicase family protein [Piscirickettsia salmonis]
MQQVKEEILKIFVDTLPAKPYCSFDVKKMGVKIWPKAGALKTNHIQVNGPTSVHWLVLDIDQPNSALLYEKFNLPMPNIISINKDNGHSHYFYHIHEVYTSKNARTAPQEYLTAIKQAYINQLGADQGYSGLIAKNPLSPEWLNLYLSNHTYTLSELAEAVNLKPNFLSHKNKIREDEGRNNELFDRLRLFAYAEKKNYPCYESFYHACLLKGKVLNSEGYQSNSGYLPLSEVQATVKSVAKWTWSKYSGSGRAHKNKGVMSLEDTTLTPTERMQAGALYSATVKREKTLDTLKRAARRAKLGINLKLNLNQLEIAQRSKLSLSTVKRYWPLILDYIFKGVIRGVSDISAGGQAAVVLFVRSVTRLLLDRRPQNMSLSDADFSGFSCVLAETERV